MKLHLAAIQYQAQWGEKTANRQRVEQILREAIQAGADFLVLPELWNSGYDTRRFPELPAQAEDLNGPSVSFLRDFARQNQIFIGGGSIVESRRGKLYNTSVFIGRDGTLLAKYRKTHLFGEEKQYFSPGDEWSIVQEEQSLGPLQVGMAICYDLRFPELFRNMTLRGSRMLSVPVAWPGVRREEYVLLARARASENRSVLIGANLTSADMSFCGASMVVSPFGEVLACCEKEEGFAGAEIDLDALLDPNMPLSIRDRRQFLDEIDDNLL